MARIKKNGFDTFELSCDFLADERVRGVVKDCGERAIPVLLSIYSRLAKHQGYYLSLGTSTTQLILGDIGESDDGDFVQSVIVSAVYHRLFDDRLYQQFGILTSEEAQTSFERRTKQRNRKGGITPEYRLIPESPKKEKEKTHAIDYKNLSRMIAQQWNMINASRQNRHVSEEEWNSDFMIEGLQDLVEKYPDYANIDPWFAIIRNAFVEHPEFRLPNIISSEPIFRVLFEMGEPQDFIPGEASPPRGFLHPAVIQESRMKKSGYSDQEILETTARLLSCQPVDVRPPQASVNEKEEEEPTHDHIYNNDVPAPDLSSSVITTYQDYQNVPSAKPASIPVFITNEAPSDAPNAQTENVETDNDYESPTRTVITPSPVPSPAPARKKGPFDDRNDVIIMDGEILYSPEEKARREMVKKEQEKVEEIQSRSNDVAETPHISENDPELSPLLKNILDYFNGEIKKRNYPDPDSLCIDSEKFSQDQRALNYLREYIRLEPQLSGFDFWKLVIEGILHLHSYREEGFPLDKPAFFFDADTLPGYGPDTDLKDRLRLMKRSVQYVTTPEKLSDPDARQMGSLFVAMKEQEKTIREKEKKERQTTHTTEQKSPTEEITQEQQKKIEAIRNDPSISRGDLGWMEERVIHPEWFKAPDKPYGDRTAPMPWARKHPPSHEELIKDPNFCHDLAYGSSIRPKD